jgi:hypothetical protein
MLDAAPAPPSSGRDDVGRFARGNSGGPGNPHARHCARMLEMFRNSITDEEMYGLCRVLYERAITGDMSALKMVWQYKLGKPLPAPHPDTIDRDEWDHFQKDAMTMDEMKQVLGQLPSRIGNAIVAAALPSITSTITHTLAQQLLQGLPAEYLSNQSNSASSEPSPAVENACAPSDPPSAHEEHPIPNGFLPAQPNEQASVPSSPSTRHTPLATIPSPVANGILPAQPTGAAPVPSSPATRQTAPATRPQPIPNGSSKKSKVKGGRAGARPNSSRKHWLKPLANKLNGRNSKGKKKLVKA